MRKLTIRTIIQAPQLLQPAGDERADRVVILTRRMTRWNLETLFRDAADSHPGTANRAQEATEELRRAGIDHGYYVMADGIVLRSYQHTQEGREAAVTYADGLRQDRNQRCVIDGLWQAETDEFVTLVYEVGAEVKLIHSVEPPDEHGNRDDGP